jgi:8-oxo-dGTP pyrophosphatase MutT (NUDIX family)
VPAPVLLSTDDAALVSSTDLRVAVAQLRAAELVPGGPDDHRRQVLDHLAARADVAHRTSSPGHLTGSALVVDAAGRRTLLMLHRKLRRWFQPGGHADGDTNLAAVALREATEETGIGGLRVAVPAIDVDIHRLAPPGEEAHLHLDTRFLVVAPPGALEVANEESLDLRWVDEAGLDDLEPVVDAGTRRLVVRGLAVARDLLGGRR